MPRKSADGLDLVVLAAIHRLGDDARAYTIRADILRRTDYQWSLGTIYHALEVLRSRGLISDRTEIRPGKAMRYYRVTEAAAALLADGGTAP
jgi:DNA-binding PadR family transcriptional regulator